MPKRRPEQLPRVSVGQTLPKKKHASASSSLFMSVPDVLGLIALQMDNPLDFASFSLTCSAWYQATVDNAHLFNTKIYETSCRICKTDRYRYQYRHVCKVMTMLHEVDDEAVEICRKHGSKLLQISYDCRDEHCNPWIIGETIEGYWLVYVRGPGQIWDIYMYNPELAKVACIRSWSGAEVYIYSYCSMVELWYPLAEDDKASVRCYSEEEFRTWTSVQDLQTYSRSTLVSLPSNTVRTRSNPVDKCSARLLEAWLDCIRVNEPLHHI